MTVGPGTYTFSIVVRQNKNEPQHSSSTPGNTSATTTRATTTRATTTRATTTRATTTRATRGITTPSSSSISVHPYKRSHAATSNVPRILGPNGYDRARRRFSPVLVPARRPHPHVQGAQNPGALGPPNPRAEKRRFIQQHLVLILHAFQCRRKQLHEFCQLPHCSTFREVLGHMTSCKQELACHFPHCTSSKQIYRHWKSCHRADCSICVPIRLADRLERNHY